MTTADAKLILEGMRPVYPRQLESYKQQDAIDIAIHALTFYEDFIRVCRNEDTLPAKGKIRLVDEVAKCGRCKASVQPTDNFCANCGILFISGGTKQR